MISRLPFFLLHAAILFLLLVPAKLAKGLRLAPDVDLLTHAALGVPDVLFILLLEGAVLGAVGLTAGKIRPYMRAFWGLLLLPLVAFGAAEHRFFVSSGSFLDWGLLTHGLLHLDEISGVVGAELSVGWAALLGSSVPIGLFMTWLGFKGEHRGPKGVAGAIVGLAASVGLVLMAMWGGSKPDDPRLASLRGSFFANLMVGAMDGLEGTTSAPVNLNADLPDAVELEAGPDTKPMNIVFIVLESVRAESTSAYNDDLDTSPFLKELADTGLKAEHAYTTLPHTTKSLVPILCGVPPDIRQPLTETVPGAIPFPCLATLLKPLGYRSAFFQPATKSFEQRAITVANAGFEHFVAREHLKTRGFESPNYLGVEEAAMNEPILDWIDDGEGPFFLSILTLITHHDYKVPSDFEKKTYEGVSERISNYYNTIRYTDQWLQGMWAEFEERGLTQNTLFVLMGDHGEGHGEHGRKGHDEIMYEQGIRVPLVFWGPSVIDKPQVVQGLRQNIDLVPSVVDMLDLEITQGEFMGESVLKPVDDRVIYTSCWYENRCLGRLKWPDKFVYYYDRHPIEYFDLSQDPQELESHASELKPAQIDAWVAEMEAWKQDIQSLYATHQKERNTGFILFERPEVENAVTANFSDEIAPIGYEVEGELKPGKDVTLSVFYEVLDTMGWHWKLYVDLKDADGQEHKLRYKSSEDGHPLYTWVPGQYRKVEYRFRMPRSFKEGEGFLRIGVKGYRGKRLKVTGPDADTQEKLVPLKVTLGK